MKSPQPPSLNHKYIKIKIALYGAPLCFMPFSYFNHLNRTHWNHSEQHRKATLLLSGAVILNMRFVFRIFLVEWDKWMLRWRKNAYFKRRFIDCTTTFLRAHQREPNIHSTIAFSSCNFTTHPLFGSCHYFSGFKPSNLKLTRYCFNDNKFLIHYHRYILTKTITIFQLVDLRKSSNSLKLNFAAFSAYDSFVAVWQLMSASIRGKRSLMEDGKCRMFLWFGMDWISEYLNLSLRKDWIESYGFLSFQFIWKSNEITSKNYFKHRQ